MKNKHLGKNLFYNIAYQILIVLLPLVISPYLSRTLGPEASGIYSYSFSIAHYFVIFALLGISTYGNRLIASVRDNKEDLSKNFWSLLWFHFIISFIVVILYLFYCWFFCSENVKIALILSFYVLSSVFDISWFFFGVEEFKTTVIRNTIVKLVNAVCVFIFVKSQNDLWIYTLIMSIGYFVSQLILWPFLLKKIQFVRVGFYEIFKHFKPNVILFLPVIATSIFSYMDKIMLGALSNNVEVGYYDYSEKIIEIPKSIIRAVGTVMLPTTTNMLVKGEVEESKKFLAKTMFYSMGVGIPMLFGLAAIAMDFAPLYFGEQYVSCGILITILCPVLLFSMWGNVIRTQYLIPAHKDKEYIISLFVGAIINVVLNIVFIRFWGAVGAAIGTIGAEVSLCVLQTIFVRKHISVWHLIKNSLLFIPGGVVMFVCVFIYSKFTEMSYLNLIIEIFLGMLVYIASICVLLFLSKNEYIIQLKDKLKKIINKKEK